MEDQRATEAEGINATPSVQHVVRSVMLGQWLFTAGHVLTTGGFFLYFVEEFKPTALLLSLLMIAPETSQAASVIGRWTSLRHFNRKRVWMTCLISGRLFALLIPLAVFWPENASSTWPLLCIFLCTIAWYLFQGIAYVNYVSWISDLVPREEWGRLFSRRQISFVIASLMVPLTVAWIRRTFLKDTSPFAQQASYGVIFITGGVLCMLSVLPMLRLPHVQWAEQAPRQPIRFLAAISRNRSFQFLLASRWWLAFFQGLTQAILFRYTVRILEMPIENYYLLINVMLITQLPLAWLAGKLSDRSYDKVTMSVGMVIVSLSMFIWLQAVPGQWEILGFAYLLWGGFALINVAGNNLCLKLSPRGDNIAQFALYDQCSGLIAGIAGLIGGFCLDELLQSSIAQGADGLLPYQILILVSCFGRLTAPLWLIPIKQPRLSFPSTRADILEPTKERGQ